MPIAVDAFISPAPAAPISRTNLATSGSISELCHRPAETHGTSARNRHELPSSPVYPGVAGLLGLGPRGVVGSARDDRWDSLGAWN